MGICAPPPIPSGLRVHRTVVGLGMREYQDDLASVSAAVLRREGVIIPGAASALVCFDEGGVGVRREVKLWHRVFRNGRGLSLFLCPACGGKAKFLRLYDGRWQCRKCLIRQGLQFRIAYGTRGGKRAAAREKHIERLRVRVGAGSLRACPSKGRGVEGRRSLEMSLRRGLIREREKLLEPERLSKAGRDTSRRPMMDGDGGWVPISCRELDLAVVEEVLVRCNCCIAKAAKELGIPASDLRRLVIWGPLKDAATERVEQAIDDAAGGHGDCRGAARSGRQWHRVKSGADVYVDQAAARRRGLERVGVGDEGRSGAMQDEAVQGAAMMIEVTAGPLKRVHPTRCGKEETGRLQRDRRTTLSRYTYWVAG